MRFTPLPEPAPCNAGGDWGDKKSFLVSFTGGLQIMDPTVWEYKRNDDYRLFNLFKELGWTPIVKDDHWDYRVIAPLWLCQHLNIKPFEARVQVTGFSKEKWPDEVEYSLLRVTNPWEALTRLLEGGEALQLLVQGKDPLDPTGEKARQAEYSKVLRDIESYSATLRGCEENIKCLQQEDIKLAEECHVSVEALGENKRLKELLQLKEDVQEVINSLIARKAQLESKE